MKIVIASAVYYPMINGVAMFSHNLAVGLAKRGHEVLVICPSQTGKSYTRTIDGVKTCYLRSVETKIYPDQIHAVPKKRKFLGIEMPRLFYEHGFRISVFPKREVKRILEDFMPEVVHVQVSDMIGVSVVAHAKKMGIPVVTTEHNRSEVLTSFLKMPNFVKGMANGILESYFVWRHEKSDYVTMPTQLAINELLKGRKFYVPIEAVSNGVDLKDFKAGVADEKIYEKYGLSKNAPIVLYVGRVDPEKRVETVLEAFMIVLKKIPKAELVIVGDGVDLARLKEKAVNLGISASVKFLGRVVAPDLYELYKVGWVFATASEIETQGIVLIEAAATGLPLVAVNAGAVAEVCCNNENGFLVEKDESKNSEVQSMMAEGLSKILEDEKLRKSFSVKSRKIAEEHDFEKTLDKFEKIYYEVMIK